MSQCSELSAFEARTLIDRALDEQSQQLWHDTSFVVESLKQKMLDANHAALVAGLDELLAYDANSTSGLSQQAEAMLALSKAALAYQIEKDYVAGLLDEAMKSGSPTSWDAAPACMSSLRRS